MKLSLSHKRWIAFRGLAIFVEYREISPKNRETLRAALADTITLAAARASGDLDNIPDDLKGAEAHSEDLGTRMVAGCVLGMRGSKLEEAEGSEPKPTGKQRALKFDYYNGDGNIHEGAWEDLNAEQRHAVLLSFPKLTEALTTAILHVESALLLGK